MIYLTVGRVFERVEMETAYLSPHRGATRPAAQRGQTSAGKKPAGGDLHPPAPAPAPAPAPQPSLHAGNSPEETPASSDGRRNSGVKKHHHKHNLKHRYELLETLGRGTYGKVKKAIERHSGREVSHRTAVNICQGGFLLKCVHALHRRACICSTNNTGPLRGVCTSPPPHTHTCSKGSMGAGELWLHTPCPVRGLTTGCRSANPATD